MGYLTEWSRRQSFAIALLALLTSPALAQKAYGPGVTDSEIKIGQTMPYSGPASAWSTVGKAQAAYFKMINENGGINGRKVTLISYDDAYSPPKAVEQVRRLVESDEVLLIFQMLGSPSNAAVQKYLNQRKVPQLLSVTGATRFSNYKEFPWTMAFNPNYQSEGHIYAKFIQENYPNARIGILYQNDDFGKDYVKGLKDGLGAKAASMIVSEVSCEVTDPTVDSQVVRLKASGADLFYNITSAKQAAQSIRKAAELGWKPIQILGINSTSVGAVLKPAGTDASTGILSVNYTKDPLDPQWSNDPGMKRYFAFMEKYYAEGDRISSLNSYGYLAAQVLHQILQRAGDDLTRENVMNIATNLSEITTDLSLPGMTASTSKTDYRLNKQFQMMRFDGERWVLFGPILVDEMPID